MSTVLKVEDLGKKYILHHQRTGRYIALRDVIADSVKSLGKKVLNPMRYRYSVSHSSKEEFWALKDVSFEVEQGDRVGIIGRNGAGKSTLLKLLSRITEPTSGRITIKGRVASLLEVGTGFHPELTGRENIFLNGAVLGMGRAEIRRKFDEIVDFAEVEKFLDTPVKRYSSGMYVRLAFAVAAHLEPKILIVDEVLAVGDAQFQKKCLGKMEAVAQEGRTVLFVSHNMNAISSLCSTGIVLANGKLQFEGDARAAISHYLMFGADSAYTCRENCDTGYPVITRAWFENKAGDTTSQYYIGEEVYVVIESANPEGIAIEISLSFWDNLRRPLWNFTHEMHGLKPIPGSKRTRARIAFHPPQLTISELLVDMAIGPKGGFPYYDHIISGIKCAIIEKGDGILYRRFPEWPIFCDAQLTYEVLNETNEQR
jgi:lipopolysaccharide transport system ATP-binding protein